MKTDNDFNPSDPMRTGVAWYRREQWDLLRSVSADVEILEETYDEWLEFAEEAIDHARKSGVILEKVDVDVDVYELINWCAKEKRPVDVDARSWFVIDKMNE